MMAKRIPKSLAKWRDECVTTEQKLQDLIEALGQPDALQEWPRITDYPTVQGTHRVLKVDGRTYRLDSKIKLAGYDALAAVLLPMLPEELHQPNMQMFFDAVKEPSRASASSTPRQGMLFD